MFKKIFELLDYVKADVAPKGLDYVFPEANNIYYVDNKGNSNFIYVRVDDSTFHVAKSLWDRKNKDFESEISSEDMLNTVKQSLDEYEVRIQKTSKGYDITLIELDSE